MSNLPCIDFGELLGASGRPYFEFIFLPSNMQNETLDVLVAFANQCFLSYGNGTKIKVCTSNDCWEGVLEVLYHEGKPWICTINYGVDKVIKHKELEVGRCGIAALNSNLPIIMELLFLRR